MNAANGTDVAPALSLGEPAKDSTALGRDDLRAITNLAQMVKTSRQNVGTRMLDAADSVLRILFRKSHFSALPPELLAVLRDQAKLNADIACYCDDVRRGLRDGAGMLDLGVKAARLNERTQKAIGTFLE